MAGQTMAQETTKIEYEMIQYRCKIWGKRGSHEYDIVTLHKNNGFGEIKVMRKLLRN